MDLLYTGSMEICVCNMRRHKINSYDEFKNFSFTQTDSILTFLKLEIHFYFSFCFHNPDFYSTI